MLPTFECGLTSLLANIDKLQSTIPFLSLPLNVLCETERQDLRHLRSFFSNLTKFLYKSKEFVLQI